MRVILASGSPRRRELLEQIGIKFEVMVSEADENIPVAEPWRLVEELSDRKATAVLHALESCDAVAVDKTICDEKREELLVIGADTVVSVDEMILGKPENMEHAKKMLRALAGRNHQVYTGVTLLHKSSEGLERKTFHEVTKVAFFPMTEEEIDTYLVSENCMDKAGAYAIQGVCAKYIRGIEGDYNNVVGLPVGRLFQEAKRWLE